MPLRSAAQIVIHGRILLVDGNAAGLAARKMVLEEHGHKVSVATGVTDAMEQFASHKFDVVVTDHKPPRMDGLGLLRKVHAISADTPVVVLSGLVKALGLTEASTGAAAVIQKSAEEVTKLVRSVERLLKRKPARKGPVSQSKVRSKRATA